MSPSEPSPLEEELEALRSIFGADWEDLPPQKTAWNIKGEEGWWTVKVRGDDERVTAKLKGRCTRLYPRAPPIISIEESTGLSPAHITILNRLIHEKAKELSSKEDPPPFIFDVTYFVGEWISNNHIPLPRPGEKVPTLMEERAQREQAQKQAKVAQSQAQVAAQLAQADEQARLLEEKIQLDASRKAQKASQAMQDQVERQRREHLAGLADGELEIRQLHLDEPLTVDGFDGAYDSWILFSGKRQPLWTSYTAEPDGGIGGLVKASLPSITVQVVDFSTPFYSTVLGRKRVDAVAAELCRLKEIRSENVVRIYGVKRDKSPKGWERLIVMTESLADGAKVKTWLPKDGFGEEIAREYITHVLAGLVDIHRKGATQKQVDPDCTILTPRVSGEALAKLSGTGYARRIGDLHRSNPFLRSYEDTLPDSWLSPDELDSPYTYTAKRDVWHAGLLFVQLIFGAQALWKYPNLHILLQHAPGTSESNIDLLNGLLHPNHKKRLTSEEALNRARSVDEVTRKAHTLSNSISGGLHRPASRGAIISPSVPSPQNVFGSSPVGQIGYFPGYPSTPSHVPRNSRYREDFEEVEFLGKGGFGEVVKARNRLDGRSYAIKKVKLRPEDNEAKVYREVNNLSRVSHQYIVRYHACWIEYLDRPDVPEVSATLSEPHTPTAPADEGSDIFALNFDDVSRRDQSRSQSFPRIRFANDDDDEDGSDDDSDVTESSSGETVPDPSASEPYARGRIITGGQAAEPRKLNPNLSLTGTTTDDEAVQSILYIQMEFVEKQTLREAITAGLGEDEVWRILSQILQALAHMSSLGIVHRDLKPSNILLDASGNVKIADFGLSTTDLTAMETAAANVAAVHADHNKALVDFSDQTSGIGTSLYIAPEVAISRSYNEKADMYSLGVIFFEMCFAFKTNMERVHILTALRQPSITFPDAWPKGFKTNQREIIEWLLRHDPNMRPRAEQLLNSPLLPAREHQKEFYDSAIAELTNPRSTYYPSLLHALFDPQTHIYTSLENRKDDYTFDNDNDNDYDLQVWLTVVTQRLVDLFQRHGAVETYLPLFIPETMLLDAFPDLSPVRILDMSGKIIQLPSSGILAMARSATRRQIERIKRYHVGRRYTDHAAGGQPNVSGQLSMDIISPLKSFASEVEMLDVVDKVVKEFRGVRGPVAVDYEFHISHETILACILGIVPEKTRLGLLKALKSISTLGPSSTSTTRTVLTGIPGLPKHLIDDLEQLCVVDDFAIVRRKMDTLSLGTKRKLTGALDTLATIISLARACGITRKILFRPTLSRNAEFFRGGFMFECVRRGKQRDLLAFGGRCDSLLEHFKAPSQHRARKTYGVGMSIAVDQLARMVRKHESALSTKLMIKENEEERSFGYWSPARCDVYVASTAQVDLASRLSVVGELWRAGIRADLQYDDERSLEEVTVECVEQNTLFLVIPRANRPILKVRNILKRSEEEIPRAELCTYLRQAIAEQRRVDANYASAEGSIPIAQAASLSAGVNLEYSGGKTVESDIKLLLPPEPSSARGTKGRPVRKHRHATKSVYYDKASEFATSTATCLPILGVDLPAQFLSQLTLDPTWINDDEAWRSVLVGFSGEDRRYVDSVRDCVQEFWGGGAAHGKTWMWLFSVREGRGFLLQPK